MLRTREWVTSSAFVLAALPSLPSTLGVGLPDVVVMVIVGNVQAH